MNNGYTIAMVIIAALITAGLRFAPFLILGRDRKTPDLITYLGKVLPCSIMGMLVVYCLKDVNFSAAPFGMPELLGCAVVAALHIWKRNTLLSIGIGTLSYMLMVQYIF